MRAAIHLPRRQSLLQSHSTAQISVIESKLSLSPTSLNSGVAGSFGVKLTNKKKIQERAPVPGSHTGLESLVDKTTFLFQIDRNSASLGAHVFKSYDVFSDDGTRIFIISNCTLQSLRESITEFRVIGHDGETVLSFIQATRRWSDDECCSCFPTARDSDGIDVLLNGEEVGHVEVKGGCHYQPCVFWGFNTNPCYSRYHVKYQIEYVDNEDRDKLYRASTRRSDNYGLEVIDPDGKLIGEIRIGNNANRRVNVSPTADFVLAIKEEFEGMHANGKAVLVALTIRHQLNVMQAHRLSPIFFKNIKPKRKNLERPQITSI